MAVETVTAPPRTVHPVQPAFQSATKYRRGPVGPFRGFRWWQPGWPLTYLFTGYPLWWLLGLVQIFLLLAAVIMAIELLRMRRVFARPGFGWWLLFLAWVAIGVLLLQVDAPGAQPGASNARYLTFAYRFGLYLAATVVLLYIYNLRSRIPTIRIIRSFGWFFVTVVGGGVLGAFAPYLDFPSAVELVLPHGISSAGFVHTTVHPIVSQIVNPDQPTGTPRTSAPFAYTNDWGLSFACLLPFFLIAWFGADAGWRRHVAPWILIVSIYPVVESANRGLWIALVVSGIVFCVRAAVYGNIRFAIVAIGGAAVAVAVVLSTPLGATITDRLTNSGSEGGRATLGSDTVRSVAEKSPVVGLGTTRPVQGSFYSITGGDSADCIGCSPPPLGTQGHFWLVIYTTGFGGLLIYLGFVLVQLFRHIRLRSPIGTLGVVVLIVHLSTMLIYDTIGVELVIIFAAIALLWRESAATVSSRTGRPAADPTIAGYVGLLRRNAALVAACAILGGVVGVAYQDARGIQHEAVTSVMVPVESTSPASGSKPQTMDTLAQLVNAPEVRTAVDRIVGAPVEPGGSRLFVTAPAYTRFLQIHVVDPSASVAQRASRAAGQALLRVRARLLTDQRDDDLRALGQQRASYLSAVMTIDLLPERDPAAEELTGQRRVLLDRAESVDAQIVELQLAPIDAGEVAQTPRARTMSDSWVVAASSGLMLGVLGALLFLLARHTLGRRIGRDARGYADLPVIARLPDRNPVAPTAALLHSMGSSGVLTAGTSPVASSVAAALDDAVTRLERCSTTRFRRPGLVVLVTTPDTTGRQIDLVRESVESCGSAIAGLVVIDRILPERSNGPRHRIPWRAGRTAQRDRG